MPSAGLSPSSERQRCDKGDGELKGVLVLVQRQKHGRAEAEPHRRRREAPPARCDVHLARQHNGHHQPRHGHARRRVQSQGDTNHVVRAYEKRLVPEYSLAHPAKEGNRAQPIDGAVDQLELRVPERLVERRRRRKDNRRRRPHTQTGHDVDKVQRKHPEDKTVRKRRRRYTGKRGQEEDQPGGGSGRLGVEDERGVEERGTRMPDYG